MACLDSRLRETRALIGLFTEVDAKTVERTSKVLDALSSIDDCSNPKLLLA